MRQDNHGYFVESKQKRRVVATVTLNDCMRGLVDRDWIVKTKLPY